MDWLTAFVFLLGLIIGSCLGVHAAHEGLRKKIKAGYITENGKTYKLESLKGEQK